MKEQRIYTKNEALLIIMDAAKIYHKNLENKDLLIIYKNGKNMEMFEIGFLGSNFQHFTGVKSNLSPMKFYNAALYGRLKINDFEFKNNELTSKKIDILKKAMELPKNAKMIGYYNGPKVELQADMGAGDVKYVMTFRNDKNKGDNWLHPVGIQKEDIRDVTTKSPIVFILKKDSGDSIYNELTYKSKNINFDKLHMPKELKNIISENILNHLVPQQCQEELGQPTKETLTKSEVVHDGKNQNKKKPLSERIAEGKAKVAEHNKTISQHKVKEYEQER